MKRMAAIDFQVATTQLDIEQMLIIGSSDSELKEKENELKNLNKMVEIINTPPPPEKRLSLRKEIAEAFGISEKEMFMKTRRRECVGARQMYILLMMTINLPEGKHPILFKKNGKRVRKPIIQEGRKKTTLMGIHTGLDHATMYHSCRTMQNLIETEKNMRALYERLREGLLNRTIQMPDVTGKANEGVK